MKFLLIPLVWILSYLVSAFVQANFNSTEWSMDARFFCALLMAMSSMLTLLTFPIFFDEK